MSSVSYAKVLSILQGWEGTLYELWWQWETTYNFTIPPPPPFPTDIESLAEYIAAEYKGPPIP